MVSGKCALGRGSGASPQKSVSMLLSKHYFKLQLGKLLRGGGGGGEA